MKEITITIKLIEEEEGRTLKVSSDVPATLEQVNDMLISAVGSVNTDAIDYFKESVHNTENENEQVDRYRDFVYKACEFGFMNVLDAIDPTKLNVEMIQNLENNLTDEQKQQLYKKHKK